MTCPYVGCRELSAFPGPCPSCGRPVKRCDTCGQTNRPLSRFCRACGRPLPPPAGDWTGFRGGPERSSINPGEGMKLVPRISEPAKPLSELGSVCRSLLSYDGILIAVGAGGRVAMIDSTNGLELAELAVDGPITAEPVVADGLLFLGTAERVQAFSLARLLLAGSGHEPLWERRLPGTPVFDSLLIDRRLYLRVVDRQGQHVVLAVDRVFDLTPSPVSEIFRAPRLSALAAQAFAQQLVFLSEDRAGVRLHLLDYAGSERPRQSSGLVAGAPRPLSDLAPIALVGPKVLAVLGEDDQLCRFHAEGFSFEASLFRDTKTFALDGMNDGVLVQSHGLSFLPRGLRDELGPTQRVKGQPLLVRGKAMVVGLKDGKVRVYDLAHLPTYQELQPGKPGDEITALASFGRFLAVGTRSGRVQLYDLSAVTPPPPTN